jgi:hypothetical protein
MLGLGVMAGIFAVPQLFMPISVAAVLTTVALPFFYVSGAVFGIGDFATGLQ